MDHSETGDTRVEEYWDWFAVALFLLITVDMFTTLGAAAEYGLAAEVNPIVVWLLRTSPYAFAAANLLAVVLAVYAFSGVLAAVERAPEPYSTYLTYAVELWLGLLIAVGLFVFANNILLIIHGESLL